MTAETAKSRFLRLLGAHSAGEKPSLLSRAPMLRRLGIVLTGPLPDAKIPTDPY